MLRKLSTKLKIDEANMTLLYKIIKVNAPRYYNTSLVERSELVDNLKLKRNEDDKCILLGKKIWYAEIIFYRLH